MNELMSGFVGAFLGAGVGFFAVVWQFRAQRLQVRRTLAAELLFSSQKLLKLCRLPAASALLKGGRPSLSDVAAIDEEMRLYLQKYELVGDQSSYMLLYAHVRAATAFYHSVQKASVGQGWPSEREHLSMEKEWSETRKSVTDRLATASGHRPWQIWKRTHSRLKSRGRIPR